MNDKLRSVQCFSTTSKRVADTKNDGTFTVEEYRIYRAITSAPMSVSETQSMRDAVKKYASSQARWSSVSIQNRRTGHAARRMRVVEVGGGRSFVKAL